MILYDYTPVSCLYLLIEVKGVRKVSSVEGMIIPRTDITLGIAWAQFVIILSSSFDPPYCRLQSPCLRLALVITSYMHSTGYSLLLPPPSLLLPPSFPSFLPPHTCTHSSIGWVGILCVSGWEWGIPPITPSLGQPGTGGSPWGIGEVTTSGEDCKTWDTIVHVCCASPPQTPPGNAAAIRSEYWRLWTPFRLSSPSPAPSSQTRSQGRGGGGRRRGEEADFWNPPGIKEDHGHPQVCQERVGRIYGPVGWVVGGWGWGGAVWVGGWGWEGG